MKRSNSSAQEAKEAVLAPITNGNTSGSPLKVIKDAAVGRKNAAANIREPTERSKADNNTQTLHEQRKDKENLNRRSYFSKAEREKDEESGWVTTSDLNSRAEGRDRSGRDRSISGATGRRSSSSQRPETATGSVVSGNGSLGGSVRKRLSLLKLGKKSSKGNMLMGGLREED
jgi:hypothetical protein